MFGKQGSIGQEETDFSGSCCDYNSDVFKEQPSYQGDGEYSKFERDAQEALSGESPLEYDIRENPLYSHNLVSSQSNKISTNSNFESDRKIRMLVVANQNSDSKYKPSFSNIGSINKISKKQRKENISKTSSEQSVNLANSQIKCQPTCQTGIFPVTTQNSTRHQKQPLYSMIPQSVNKNLNAASSTKSVIKQNEENNHQSSILDFQANNQLQAKSSATSILAQIDTNKRIPQNLIYCEEAQTPQNHSRHGIQTPHNQGSILNLTPQKRLPIPISPTQKPNLTSSSSNNLNNLGSNKQIQNINTQYQQQMNSDSKERFRHGSAQKATVVYNEFKYYTQSNELANLNQKKYINISNTGVGMSRKSDIDKAGSAICSVQNFELSPGENKMFEVSSPKLSIGTPNQQIANSNQKFRMGFGNSITDTSNIQLQAQARSEQETQNITEQRFKELQQYIEQLEYDLKQQQNRNHELKKKFKERSFMQSIERSKKHLSDTEDSLILSEKKAHKRSSVSKINGREGSNQNQILEKERPGVSGNQSQNALSIVDVKIRPASSNQMQKLGTMGGTSPSKPNYQVSKNTNNQKKLDSDSEALDYQVQDFNDMSNSQADYIEDVNNGSQEDQEQDFENHGHSNDEECEGCERLKQLVFQAKEAIDDLKVEIEEWRELCAEKDTEIRQIHHKIYNDIIAVDKKIEFNNEIQTKEFDSSHPVNVDFKKVRNFIQHNKKRIRSRSKNPRETNEKVGKNRSGITNCNSSVKKRSSMKQTKYIMSEEYELYEAEDQGIQTSFVCTQANTNDQSSASEFAPVPIPLKLVPQPGIAFCQNYYQSNQTVTNCLSVSQAANQEFRERETINGSQIARSSEETQLQIGSGGFIFNQEEIINLRARTTVQEQEIHKLRAQLQTMSKQCELFVQISNKIKRKVKKQPNQQIDLNELKENNEIISPLESYSILEKINEWKKEEGLVDQHGDDDGLPPSQIPRPIKLILDIEPSEIQEYTGLKNNNQTTISQTSNDFLSIIKQEQDQLKRQQELKYQELQKQQQDYLNLLKGI